MRKTNLFVYMLTFIVLASALYIMYFDNFDAANSQAGINDSISENLINIIVKDTVFDADINRYFYVFKFITDKSDTNLSFWVQPNFPSVHITQEGIVKTNMINVSYYLVRGKNVVIIDYPKSSSYDLYIKDNSKALLEYQKDSILCSVKGPLLNHRVSNYYTYKILNKELIQIGSSMPHKYDNEEMLQIIDEEIDIDSIF